MRQSGFGHTGARARRIGIVLAGIFLAAAGGTGTARSQESAWVPELPLTRDCGSSARAIGMGGAYLAISDDAAALRYNPAGLARVQRIELSGTLTDRSRDIETAYYGSPLDSRFSRTRISSLGIVYPFPTYRGSLVAALGYADPWPFDLEYARAGSAGAGATPLQEQILEENGLGEWSFGLAVDASPTLSLGFRASWLHGDRFQDWVFRDANHSIHEVIDVTLDGFTASFGALNHVGAAHLGLTVDLPRWIFIKGDDRDAVADITYAVDEKMTMPFSVGLGTAVPLRGLLLAGDARFTDWTQIDYYGPLRYADPASGLRRFAYERTWDLHLGAEYLLDFVHAAGVRVRAGWASEPIPYRVLLEEVDLTPEGAEVPIYRPVSFDPQRSTWSVGVGVLAGESLTIDAAFTSGSWKRTGLHLSEKETERRVLISAAFRLE
jgi:hypothetical protein